MKGKRNDWALGNVQNQVPDLVFKPESSENEKNWGKNMTENEQIGGRVIEGRDSVYSFISLSVVKYGGKKGVELTLEIPFTKQRLGKLLSVDDARKLSARLKELADFLEVCDEEF